MPDIIIILGLFFTIKTLPATSRITPLFPHPPDFRGHNSGKRGTGLELLSDFRREQMRSNIAMLQKPKQGWDVFWDMVGTGRGIFLPPPREVLRIDRHSAE
jgi:hypothetical protein